MSNLLLACKIVIRHRSKKNTHTPDIVYRINRDKTFNFFVLLLRTGVDAFKPDSISEPIVRRLLKQDIMYHIKVKSRDKARADPATVIYQQGKPVDYFVLILEGRVEVTVGKENLMFESGPFTYFGSQALTANVGIGKALKEKKN